MTKIIDVSKWQGNINWSKVAAADVGMATLRASCGLTKDPKVDEYAKGCRDNNIPFGVYHFTYLTTVARAQTEADFFYNAAKNLNPNYWVLDLEDSSIITKWNGGQAARNEVLTAIDAFCARLRSHGVERVVIYTWEWWGKLLPDDRYHWAWRWYANYGKDTGEVVSTVTGCQLHQYTSKGKVDGIAGNVDLSILKDGTTIAQLLGTAAETAGKPDATVIPDPVATEIEEAAIASVAAGLKYVSINQPKTWNVRSGNDATYQSLGKVSIGEDFKYVAKADNGWLAFVYKPGVIGWISPKAAEIITK